MTRFARILSLLAVLALGLSPFAPAEAQCADQNQEAMAAMPDMPCCPDEAPATPMTCKIGCVQLPALAAMAVSEPASLTPTFIVAVTVEPLDQFILPDPKPPRLSFRI
ncbi:hypothetical protein [Ferrovibrio sp.]|jgi:hypothetical protein|uniref:hypothetical protein n=1 Tax=Ferrovibrio sp. TaxID=1917215 RepID=UPI00262D3D29|nr:hypothetical protein [Ferrovibrio sp.]